MGGQGSAPERGRHDRGPASRETLAARLTRFRKYLSGATRRNGLGTCKQIPARNEGGLRPVRDGNHTALRNMVTCKLGGVCPDCGRTELLARRQMVQTGLTRLRALGGSAVLVTLTLSFEPGTGLAQRWTLLQKSIESLSKQADVMRERTRQGWIGALKIIHPVYVDGSGWHLHVHFVYFFKREVTQAGLERLRDVEVAVWRRIAGKRGLSKPSAQAQDYQLIHNSKESFDQIAKYLTKGAEEIQFNDRRPTMEDDVAERGRSQWSVLNDLADGVSDEVKDLAVWHEWESASRRRHLADWSSNVTDFLKLPTRSSERLEQRIDPESPSYDQAPFVITDMVRVRDEYWHAREIRRRMAGGCPWSEVVAYCLGNGLAVVFDHDGFEPTREDPQPIGDLAPPWGRVVRTAREWAARWR
jgi:hypothetical protein